MLNARFVREIRGEREPAEWSRFYALNALVLSLVLIVYMTINAEGLRASLPIFGMRLSKLPLPGFGLMARYDGFDRLDLAHLTAFAMLIGLLAVWQWVVRQVGSFGSAEYEREEQRPFFLFELTIAVLMIGIEALIFYRGLAAFGGGMWGGTSEFISIGATGLYALGMAKIAAWHTRFKYSE
ncbi:MAG: hypothetical protein AAF532_07660 [Planctomycetota bacterium]